MIVWYLYIELEEKDKVISKLTRKLRVQKAEELIREKKQDEESKPTDKSIDDITFGKLLKCQYCIVIILFRIRTEQSNYC